ncbi:MAG TPA: hypothetical protein VN782_14480 [Usitatibacter sp.]|nr:hypothetical protein [Usitatibacter sp.]
MENPSLVPTHDAQRELEQHALRNVRSLVEKLEGAEARRGERNLRLVALVLAALSAAVAIAALAFWLVRGPVQSHTVTLAPPGAGPASR